VSEYIGENSFMALTYYAQKQKPVGPEYKSNLQNNCQPRSQNKVQQLVLGPYYLLVFQKMTK
jgi:hypothetical protein